MNPSTSYSEIREAALALREEERAALAEDLFNTIEWDEVSESEGLAWQERMHDLVSGKLQGVPLEEALGHARNRLKRDAQTKISSGHR